MPLQATIKCAQCGMAFPNDDALVKHKSRFCVGVKDSGIGRRVVYSDDEYTNGRTRKNYPTDRPSSRRVVKYQGSLDRKRDEVQEWKLKRSMLQDIKDKEDRLYYDSQKPRKHPNNRRHNDEYNHILHEFERLEAQEREVLRQMANLENQPGPYSNGFSNHERNQLESLKRENARLEQERRRNFQTDSYRSTNNDQLTTLPNYEPHKLLRSMKEQENRSQKNLYTLLGHPDNRRSLSTELPSLPYLHSQRQTSNDDARSLRNAYLQAGGHNAAVLVSYSDMERQLCQYEPYPSLKDNPEPLRRQKYYPVPALPGIETTTTTSKISVVKNENQRLQNELDDIRRRFQGLDSRTKQLELGITSGRASEPITTGNHSFPVANDNYSFSLSKSNGHLPMNSLIHTSTRQNDHLRRSNRPLTPTNDRYIGSHILPPYDPIDGFVIYFDFISNLSPGIDRIRLISCLHHEQTGLGEPSQLDACKCELSLDEDTNQTMRSAFIATKQPVPRCPPQQALKIIVEAQVILKQTPNELFNTAAWTKMPIFDNKNRLLTGRWKIPLKSLPIRHDERLSIIDTLSSFGNAELYYRLVNPRDATDQSNAALIPKSKDLYKYAPRD